MPLLRTISLFAKTVGQSVEAFPCTLVDFDGNLTTGAAGLYLQFHNKATAPTNGDVPVKSFYISAAGPTPLASIFQLLGPLTFSTGLAVGISTTTATYTAATATFDLCIDIEECHQALEGISGLTTLASVTDDIGASIWDETTASKQYRLFGVRVFNNEAVDVNFVVMVSHSNSLVANDPSATKIIQVIPVVAGATRIITFGKEGLRVYPTRTNANVDMWGIACHYYKATTTYPNFDDNGLVGTGNLVTSYYKTT